MNNLKEALDEIFGSVRCAEKDIIIEAVKRDNEETNKVPEDVAEILSIFQEVFQKRNKMTQKVINKYKQLLKIYSIEDIKKAFVNAKNDDFHKETGYKHCTPEYFSRPEQMDKWESFDPKQTTIFQLPKMNLKQ